MNSHLITVPKANSDTAFERQELFLALRKFEHTSDYPYTRLTMVDQFVDEPDLRVVTTHFIRRMLKRNPDVWIVEISAAPQPLVYPGSKTVFFKGDFLKLEERLELDPIIVNSPKDPAGRIEAMKRCTIDAYRQAQDVDLNNNLTSLQIASSVNEAKNNSNMPFLLNFFGVRLEDLDLNFSSFDANERHRCQAFLHLLWTLLGDITFNGKIDVESLTAQRFQSFFGRGTLVE